MKTKLYKIRINENLLYFKNYKNKETALKDALELANTCKYEKVEVIGYEQVSAETIKGTPLYKMF